jgi:hypothetical protein
MAGEPFDALIGTWATEATHPLVDEVENLIVSSARTARVSGRNAI